MDLYCYIFLSRRTVSNVYLIYLFLRKWLQIQVKDYNLLTIYLVYDIEIIHIDNIECTAVLFQEIST